MGSIALDVFEECDVTRVTWQRASRIFPHLEIQRGDKIVGVNNCRQLVGVMVFRKLVHSKYEYGLVSLDWIPNVLVLSGTSALLEYFIQKYEPKSIVVKGNNHSGYMGFGFKDVGKTKDGIPKYVWYANKIVEQELVELDEEQLEILEESEMNKKKEKPRKKRTRTIGAW